MTKVRPSEESVRVARIAFGRLDWSETRCLQEAASRLGLRRPSDYSHNPTKLLLQAAHQANTRT